MGLFYGFNRLSPPYLAVNYYELKQGLRLKEEVNKRVNWIIDNFDTPLVRIDGYRRVNLKIFPYYIAYVVRLAIAHSHQQPDYWITRKNKIK